MCLNRKPEGNQRKNFPSKDEIGHIHLKGMRRMTVIFRWVPAPAAALRTVWDFDGIPR